MTLFAALAVLGGALAIALRRISALMAENRRIAEEAEAYAKTRNAIDEANRDPKTADAARAALAERLRRESGR